MILTHSGPPENVNHDQEEEIIDVVDMEDCVVSQAIRREVHQNFLVHRAVHILVFDNKGKLYLQKRVLSKDENPGLWDSSAAGHVGGGERYLSCAYRELMEELNITEKLKEITRLKACAETAWEHVVVYSCVTEKEPIPDPSEILEGRFFEPFEIKSDMEFDPGRFTPTLKKIFKIVFK